MRRCEAVRRAMGAPRRLARPPPSEQTFMLVLSRTRDQTIMIGDDIEVTVVDVRGDKVRLGINAPRTVSVHRKEVYDAIRRENPNYSPGEAAKAGNPPSASPLTPGAPAMPTAADEFMRAAIEEAKP